jgi:hypothetical protein
MSGADDVVKLALKMIAGSDPQKTAKAYKLFKQREGKLYPLFVDANEEVPLNQWLKAKAGEQASSGQVKSKAGPLAYRPGWHAGDLPAATHIGAKSHGNKRLPPDTRRSDEVWAEVDMADDVDWQRVANERARITKKGTPDPKTAHITDQVPYGGFYRYKTSPTMQGNWMIGGDMRVNRILTDDEVKAINDAAGVADLPRREGYQTKGRVVGDIVDQALKLVMGAGEEAAPKAAIRAYHASPHDFEKFEWSPRTFGTGEGAQSYGAGLYFAESPLVSGRGGTYDQQFTRKLLELDRSGGDTRMSRLKIGDQPLTSYGVEYDPEFIEAVKSGNEFKYAQSRLDRWHELSGNEDYPYRDYALEKVQAWEKLLNDMHSGKSAFYPTKSRIYEVDINARPDQLLDWDAPIKEQSGKIQRAIGNLPVNKPLSNYSVIGEPVQIDPYPNAPPTLKAKLTALDGGVPYTVSVRTPEGGIVKIKGATPEEALSNANEYAGKAVKDLMSRTGGDLVKSLERGNYSIPDRTAKLNATGSLYKEGVPGLRYLDAGSRSGNVVDPTRNYVIWNDELIDLKKKYEHGGRIAKGPGGWVDDVVKMAGKAVMGEGDNVTRLSDVRSARETDALIKKIKSAVNLVKSGHFQAGRQALINQKSLDLHKSGMLPLQQGTIVTPPSTWDMPGDWRVSGYWYDEKDPRRFGYKLQNESGQTYDAAASDPRAGLRRDNPYSFGAGFKAYAGPNASPPKPVAPPVEKPATPKPPEVLDAINKEYEDLFGSEDPFKPRAHGGRIAKGPGGWLDDVVKMAGKVISGEGDDAAKAGIRAYQGSPHNFAAERLVRFPEGRTEYLVGQPDVLPDVPEGAEVLQDFPLGRMRMDKIGTGEGAQAYGHGLYLAEHELVAQGYKDALRRKGDEITFDNAPLKGPHDYNAIQSQLENKEGDWRLFKAVDEITKRQGSMGDRLGDIRNWYRNQPEMLAAIDRAEKRMTLKENPGFVYETNINADRNTFLDWDKPLSKQPEAVRRTLEKLIGGPAGSNQVFDDMFGAVPSKGGGYEYGADGGRAYKNLDTGGGKLSEILREAGIPGIKYLDAGSRGKGVAQVQVMYKGKPHGDPIPVQAWNQIDQLTNDYKAKGYDVEVQDLGTRNYVVFDDKIISIIRKYGIAGASAMLGYNLMEQLDPKQALAASMADQDYKSSRPQRSMGGNNSISGALNVARGLGGDR